MLTTVIGSIQQLSSKPCSQLWEQLSVQVFAQTITNSSRLDVIDVNENGTFEWKHEPKAGDNYLLAFSLILTREGEKTVLVEQSNPFCLQENIQVSFDFDLKDHVVWFEYINKKTLQQLRGSTKFKNPVDLKAEQIKQLSCLACLDEQDLKEWQQTYIWTEEAQKHAKECLKNEDLKSDAKIIQWLLESKQLAEVLFSFSTNGDTQDLSQLLALSTQQFSARILSAIESKRIGISTKEVKPYVMALSLIRNYFLLNAVDDGRFYDAKLIEVSALTSSKKNKLLDASLQQGGLLSYLSEVDDSASSDEKNIQEQSTERSNQKLASKAIETVKTKAILSIKERDEIDKILEWDNRFKQFPPLLALVIPVLRKSKWDTTEFLGQSAEEWAEYIKEKVNAEQKYPKAYKDRKNPLTEYISEFMSDIVNVDPSTALRVNLAKVKIANKTVLKKILQTNPAWNPEKVAPSRYFKVRDTSDKPGELTATEYEELQRLQRTIGLAGGVNNTQALSALIQSKYTSATEIIRGGKHQFTQVMQGHGLQLFEINAIHCRAKGKYDVVTDAAVHYMRHQKEGALVPKVLKDLTTPLNETLNLPSMETLFGNLDTCGCKHCQSVYSPAAYLTDMLSWIKSDVVCENNNNGFSELDSRRPDIQHIQLSCKNTNNVMPYIDLVNEVLLSHLSGDPSDNLLKELQTTKDTESLLAEPENIDHFGFDVAKIKLKTACSPLGLPYDIDWSQNRAYLEALGIKHAELIEAFQEVNPSEQSNIVWAKAYLDINDAELDILLDDSACLNGWINELLELVGPAKKLGVLLDALGIQKDEFDSIYQTQFVSGRSELKPHVGEGGFEGCSWDDFKITSELDTDIISRFIRFIRLQRKTGLSVEQLDSAIDTCNQSGISKVSLINIAKILQLSSKLNVNIDDVIGWFVNSNINISAEHTSFANALFTSTANLEDYYFDYGESAPLAPLPDDVSVVEDFITAFEGFKTLGVQLDDLHALNSGTGYYEIASTGKAVNDDFDLKVQNVWEGLSDRLKLLPLEHSDEEKIDAFYNGLSIELELQADMLVRISESLGTPSEAWDLTCINGMLAEQVTWLLGDAANEPGQVAFTINFRYLLRVSVFKKALHFDDTTLAHILESAISSSNTFFPNIDAFDWLTSTYFDGTTTLSTQTQKLKESFTVIQKYQQRMALSDLSIDTLAAWSIDWSASTLTRAVKEELVSALKFKYPLELKWNKFITPIHNHLRTQLRNALTTYYTSHNTVLDKPFKNTAAIYNHFLLDPEMEACMKTSRTKLAISSVQLLIHRAIMGLEPNICPDEDDKEEFNQWRKNYRVWEANRKVFLYPENWIDPSLRIDKTPFFEELEDALLQDEINDENCEKALQVYLSKLNDVARLDIRGTYVETEEDNDQGTIHVFGRTFSTPHEYYYRKRLVNKTWSPWEKLEIDIEGDHIIPTFFNRKLYLFFPMFIEKEHRNIKQWENPEKQNAPYFEIKMCYSKLEFGKWSSKKIFDKSLYSGHLTGPGVFNNIENKLGGFGLYDWNTPPTPELKSNGFYELNDVLYTYASLDKKKFYFWPEKQLNGDLILHCERGGYEGWDRYSLGYTKYNEEDSLVIHACDESTHLIPPKVDGDGFLARPHHTLENSMQFEVGYDRTDYGIEYGRGIYVKHSIVNGKEHGVGSHQILREHLDGSNMCYPAQNKHPLWGAHFFLIDSKHTFFINREIEKKCSSTAISKEGYIPHHYQAQSNRYIIQAHEHPYACLMLSELNRFGVKGLLASTVKDGPAKALRRQQDIFDKNYFNSEYRPVSQFVNTPRPKTEFDFSYFGAYQQYNWEVFFHVPTLIAQQLKNNGQFADAIKWIQFIFDPTNRDTGLGDKRYWMIKPFLIDVSDDSISNLMHLLGASGLSAEEEEKRQQLKAQIASWRNNPFEPHKIAEMRHRAYMLWTVCEYIDILTEWADSLFRQDTMESINEASNLYILAGEILGNRPEKIEKPFYEKNHSFNSIENSLDDFSNALIGLENEIPGLNAENCCSGDNAAAGSYEVPNLLFCIPDNPKLQEMWDRVEDRLFKIRHCMNIEGQVRELPLFQPPIDPALLVRARAMGVDIGSVLASMNAPTPHYRFNYLLQKANEYTNEVKSLGGQLLSALEKKDAEELSQIRQLHEQNMLKATRNLKKLQIDEAKESMSILASSKKLIEIRLAEYEGKEYTNSREDKAIKRTKISEGFMYAEQASSLISGMIINVPDGYLGFPCNMVHVSGGKKLSVSASSVALGFGILGSIARNAASMSSTLAGYDRRQEDWDFQVKTAKEELLQIDRQLLASEIRLAISEKELENHDLQAEQSKETYDFIKNKFTNLKLYSWMAGQVSKLNYQAYKLAYDMASMAQKAMEKELGGNEDTIKFGHWDSGKKGLLAGERLSLELKQLDKAYIDKDKRKFELNKNISLKLLDPQALISLIMNRSCTIKLEKDLFNLDFNGKTLTNIKIKSLSISVPCVTGPHVSTNIKIRMNNGTPEEFITSTAINDSGVFEANFSQAKYLPFEYMGIGDEGNECELFLDKNSEYDISTIADVVLHINYLAESNDDIESITNIQNTPVNNGYLLMSLKHDFPNQWQEALHGINLTIPTLKPEMIPYKFRLNGMSSGTIFGYNTVTKDADGELVAQQQIAPDINIVLNSDIKDVWLIYKLTS